MLSIFSPRRDRRSRGHIGIRIIRRSYGGFPCGGGNPRCRGLYSSNSLQPKLPNEVESCARHEPLMLCIRSRCCPACRGCRGIRFQRVGRKDQTSRPSRRERIRRFPTVHNLVDALSGNNLNNSGYWGVMMTLFPARAAAMPPAVPRHDMMVALCEIPPSRISSQPIR